MRNIITAIGAAALIFSNIAFANSQGAIVAPVLPTKAISHSHDIKAEGLSPKVLELALTAYHNARARGLDAKKLLTVIDYSLPSSERRMWVIDVPNDKVLYHTLVAHGKGSGNLKATSFSDRSSTHKSSLGVFVTGKPYIGHHGYSLRLIGLEKGFNDHAFARDIVFHTAWYVSQKFVQAYGRLGRSWGCPALPKGIGTKIMHQIEGGSLVFAYYPDQKWLQQSSFLS